MVVVVVTAIIMISLVMIMVMKTFMKLIGKDNTMTALFGGVMRLKEIS